MHVPSCGAMGKFEKSLGSNFAERPVSNSGPSEAKASKNVSSNKRAIIYKSCHHGSFSKIAVVICEKNG